MELPPLAQPKINKHFGDAIGKDVDKKRGANSITMQTGAAVLKPQWMTTMFKTSFRDGRGFSLVELSVALLAAVSLAAVSIPMLSASMRNMKLLSDARSIATTMTYAKLSATSQMTRCQLTFDLANKLWSLQKLNKTSGQYELQQAVNQLSMGVSDSYMAFKTASGTAPTGFPTTSSTAITFNSRGVPNAISIVYLSNRDTDLAVSVSLAGKVQIWRLQNNQWAPV